MTLPRHQAWIFLVLDGESKTDFIQHCRQLVAKFTGCDVDCIQFLSPRYFTYLQQHGPDIIQKALSHLRIDEDHILCGLLEFQQAFQVLVTRHCIQVSYNDQYQTYLKKKVTDRDWNFEKYSKEDWRVFGGTLVNPDRKLIYNVQTSAMTTKKSPFEVQFTQVPPKKSRYSCFRRRPVMPGVQEYFRWVSPVYVKSREEIQDEAYRQRRDKAKTESKQE